MKDITIKIIGDTLKPILVKCINQITTIVKTTRIWLESHNEYVRKYEDE